jgi:hypothetical protein
MNKKTIVYIAGEGHSGSTLLDMILGSQPDTFSAGELRFLAEKGIKNREYCACGSVVPECAVWGEIIAKWNDLRILDLKSYIETQNILLSKRGIFDAKKLLRKQTGPVKDFIKDTEKLYDTIFEVTGSNCIIDSSKAPTMIPILKQLGIEVRVVHLTRRFGDVLNSYKVHLKKNLEKGIEHEIKPQKTSYILFSWFYKNISTTLYSRGIEYKKIKYEDYIDDLEEKIPEITACGMDLHKLLKNRGPFVPRHLVAGSTIRMKGEIYVAKQPLGTAYKRLNKRDTLLAKFVDLFY